MSSISLIILITSGLSLLGTVITLGLYFYQRQKKGEPAKFLLPLAFGFIGLLICSNVLTLAFTLSSRRLF